MKFVKILIIGLVVVSCNSESNLTMTPVQNGSEDVTVPLIIAAATTIGIDDGWSDDVSATDDIDGDITGDIIITGDVVDSSTEGTYTLLYDVTDAAGNDAVQVSRVVTVSYCSSTRNGDAPYANSNVVPTGDGAGTPYTICTLTQLAAVAASISTDKTFDFDLRADIDATETTGWNAGTGWEPIGSLANKYAGTFDGKGHTISGLTIDREVNGQGLFGYLSGATVSNITMSSVNIKGKFYTGGVAGSILNSTVDNCSSSGTLFSYLEIVGGLVGLANSSTISNSNSSADVTATSHTVGGLAGEVIGGSLISDSYASGLVSLGGNEGGGFIGNIVASTVEYSYSTGNVATSGQYSGGFIGRINGSVIDSSYSTGAVQGGIYFSGGFSSFIDNATTVSNCFATGDVTMASGRYAGGFASVIKGSAIVSNSYSSGNITLSPDRVGGGFVASLEEAAQIQNSFAAGTLSGCVVAYCGGFVGWNKTASGDALTNVYRLSSALTDIDPGTPDGLYGELVGDIAQFKEDSFNDLANPLWDFTNSWQLNVDGLPTLMGMP